MPFLPSTYSKSREIRIFFSMDQYLSNSEKIQSISGNAFYFILPLLKTHIIRDLGNAYTHTHRYLIDSYMTYTEININETYMNLFMYFLQ